jgi:uncharacterized membrane protein YhaH (DUF805 family)
MNWYLAAWRKFAVFTGRSRRKEYWFFALFNFIALLLLATVDYATGTLDEEMGVGLLSGIYTLAAIIPSIGVSIRRLHDIGRTGWWVLIGFVPLIGSIVLLVFALLDSQPGDNQYGANPKGV